MKVTLKTLAMTAILLAPAAFPGAAQTNSTYDSQFISWPTYNGDDLELSVSDSGTAFRLWSPKAEEAVVNLYDNGYTGKPCSTLPMKFDAATGTWSVSVPEKVLYIPSKERRQMARRDSRSMGEGRGRER